MERTSYEELRGLEPRLEALEAEVRAVRDDGGRGWFCSNFLWLPLNAKLRDLIGVARKDVDPDPILRDSHAYELVYEHLSRLMPPCRSCGCRLFAPFRSARG